LQKKLKGMFAESHSRGQLKKIKNREELYYKQLSPVDRYFLNGQDIYLKKNPKLGKKVKRINQPSGLTSGNPSHVASKDKLPR
jgi:hypothetical protein